MVDWDRFSRNVYEALGVINDFKNIGIEVNCIGKWVNYNDPPQTLMQLMHQISILWSFQSASLGATRSVTNTTLVWDTGASIGLTPFRSDFIDYLPLDGVTVKDIARTTQC